MRLKQLRTERGLGQRDIADYLNCSVPVYSRYENSVHEPPIDVLRRLSDYYGVTIDYILGNDPSETLLRSQHIDLFPADVGGIKRGYHYTPPDTATPDPNLQLKQEILSKLEGLSEDKLSNALSYIEFLKSNK